MRTRARRRARRMTVRLGGEGPGPDLAGRDRREERPGRAAHGSHARRFRVDRQGRQVWRDKGQGLGGEAAERTLIATMAGRRVLGGRFVVVDLDAELGGVAKERLKLGGDGRVIGASESGRGKRRRRRGGEKLNDERERDNEGGQRRAPRRSIAASPRSTPRFSVAAQVTVPSPAPYFRASLC